MTDEDEARTRLLEHYMAKIAAKRAELVRSEINPDPAGPLRQKARSTKLTNEVVDLGEKIDRLRQLISSE